MTVRQCLQTPSTRRLRMAALVLSGIAFGLSGCTRLSEDETYCRAVAKRLVRSPSTFRVTEAIVDYNGYVSFRAEAANAYGTAVDTLFTCQLAQRNDPDERADVTSFMIDGVEVDPYALLTATGGENLARNR